MRKVLCLIICVVMLVPAFSVSAYTENEEEVSTVRLLSAPIIQTRSTMSFVEGQTGSWNIVFFVVIDNLTFEISETINYECSYIDVLSSTNNVEAYRILNDFSTGTINLLNSQNVSYATQLRSATYFYNCHSYAWYSTETNNTYWIDDPTAFFEGNTMYEEVYTPVVGDIICYYYGDENIHSGIVTEINVEEANWRCGNSNTVQVISKWGYSGLYEHNGYECPYTNFVEHNEDNPAATSVKYFHSHVFTYSRNILNLSVHKVTCSTCGHSFTENHTYRSLPGGGSRCTKCGYTTNGQIIMSDKPKPVEQ